MYLEKLKFFHNKYPEDKCISGITTSRINDIPVGTPCMIIIEPFNMFDADGTTGVVSVGRNSFRPQPPPRGSGPYQSYVKHEGPPPKSKPDKKSTVSDLRKLAEKDIHKANRVIASSVSKANLFLQFAIYNSSNDYHSCLINTRNFYINDLVPLIYDTCNHTRLHRLSDVHDRLEISNFPDILNEALRKYRYINYTFMDIAKSNKRYILEDINSIYNVLNRAYKYRISTFQFPSDRMSTMLDVLSISFYRMRDVIPVFDSRRSDGICMEMFATNSRLKGDSLMYDHNSATFRFIFAKSKENLFTIDGETLKRPCDMGASDALVRVTDMIVQEVPNDKNIKKLKKSEEA